MKKTKILLMGCVALIIVICTLIGRTEKFRIFSSKLFKKDLILEKFDEQGKRIGAYKAFIKGDLYAEATFVNGMLEGRTVKYFPNGKVDNELFYHKGAANGQETQYNKDGSLNYIAYWMNGKRYGSLLHYLGPNQIANYDAFDISNLFYYSEYDSLQKVKKAYGSIISPNVFTLRDGNVVALKDSASYEGINDLMITVATPPFVSVKTSIKINDIIYKTPEILNNTITIKKAFPIVGKYRLGIWGFFFDKDNRLIRSDSVKVIIYRK